MLRPAMTEELRGEDPGRWGQSLANLAEILMPLLDAVEAKSVVEIGAYAGDLTSDLLVWAGPAGAEVTAIDPSPQPELVELAERTDGLNLIRKPSHEALGALPPTDVVIVDGDHNYYTVSEELRLLGDRFDDPSAPLLILHDVCWPHARRDSYYAPDRIPEQERQPMAPGGGVFPGEAGLIPGGLPYAWVAEREGGPRNGVLTAVEDFVEGREPLRLVTVPAFFGLGVVWRTDAPWAGRVAGIVDVWDRNPVLARLEANRVYHLAREQGMQPEVDRLRRLNEEKAKFLEDLLGSQAFGVGDRLAGLRNPRRESSWRDAVRRLIDADD